MKRNVAIVVCLVMVVVAVWVTSNVLTGNNMPPKGYYYDLATGQLFAGPIDAHSPLGATDDRAKHSIRAHVYTCDSCTESDRQVLFLTNVNKKAREAMADQNLNPADVSVILAHGQYVAAPPTSPNQSPQWILAASPEGERLMQSYRTLCDGRRAEECLP